MTVLKKPSEIPNLPSWGSDRISSFELSPSDHHFEGRVEYYEKYLCIDHQTVYRISWRVDVEKYGYGVGGLTERDMWEAWWRESGERATWDDGPTILDVAVGLLGAYNSYQRRQWRDDCCRCCGRYCSRCCCQDSYRRRRNVDRWYVNRPRTNSPSPRAERRSSIFDDIDDIIDTFLG